ncbi:Serine protease precursor MucD/AlgY associated with sigma factor RpoE [hydrothermal vent metagenome]|uniref:Serine protease MucD/AlgY associated with sigma factor RpoE n=1 Tax=hydrothermal vent metagenome TaxID=652676 RepID=A0A3B0SZC4_9ZZZZ
MTKIRKILICIFLFAVGGIAHSHAGDANVTFPDIVRKITPSIVAIATDSPLRSPRVVMKGSGFVVHDGLHIITNAHVLPREQDLQHNEKITVLIGRGRSPDRRIAEVIRIDREHDLALLRIKGNKIPKFILGSGGLIPEGTDIAVTGFPIGAVMGLFPVTHKGIVAAVTPIVIPQPTARYLDAKIIQQTRYDVYQLDLTAFPGNSGSPMYNAASGKVEGVLNSVFVKGRKENALTKPTGISFAIPVVHLHNLLRDAGLK